MPSRSRTSEVDGLEVRGPYPGQPHDLMGLDGIHGRQLVLMMIPPYTDPDHAYEVMRRLVDPGRSETYRVQCDLSDGWSRIFRFLNMRPVCLV